MLLQSCSFKAQSKAAYDFAMSLSLRSQTRLRMLLQSRYFKAQSKAAYVITKLLFESSNQSCL
jgi:hypothetical protein